MARDGFEFFSVFVYTERVDIVEPLDKAFATGLHQSVCAVIVVLIEMTVGNPVPDIVERAKPTIPDIAEWKVRMNLHNQ